MRQKYMIGVLSLCIVVLTIAGGWFWYAALYDTSSTKVQEFSGDDAALIMKKTPLPDKKMEANIEPKVDPTTPNTNEQALVDMNGAVNLYKKQYPTAQITGITYEEQDGRKSYEVAGISSEAGHSVTIDAMTGQVMGANVEAKSASAPMSIDVGDVITPEEAGNVAIAVLGSHARLLKWDLETRGYVARYHMMLDVSGTTVYVVLDAFSSEVIEVVRER